MDLHEIVDKAETAEAETADVPETCCEDEEFILERAIIHDVAKRAKQREVPNSMYEAYAMLKDLKEKAEKAESGAAKLIKQLWEDIGDNDVTAFRAYVGQLATEARNAAIAYANLAALAVTSEDIE